MTRHCVVLAGGLGTRLRPVTNGLLPKVMVPILGRPFLEYKLESLEKMEVTHVHLLIGELGDLVVSYLNNDYRGNLQIKTYSDGATLRGTAGSIAHIVDLLPERFWVTYGDTIVNADLEAAEAQLHRTHLKRIMVVLHNCDAYEISNTSISENQVIQYEKGAAAATHEWLDYGLLLLTRTDFKQLATSGATDLGEVMSRVISIHGMMAWEATERFWDVGSPTALMDTEAELRRRGYV